MYKVIIYDLNNGLVILEKEVGCYFRKAMQSFTKAAYEAPSNERVELHEDEVIVCVYNYDGRLK